MRIGEEDLVSNSDAGAALRRDRREILLGVERRDLNNATLIAVPTASTKSVAVGRRAVTRAATTCRPDDSR